ncbi:glycosyltransferase family 2 protein [Rhodoferax sp. U2-2l]|uniref:glycosyltransferase family 2 protein n=1 Tax=Rhodoferax sp. U2-2l TaxID=2884000 RepID=UPI001D0BD413|nr:glycosyltransferase family 2 protein [Rhodoferax sp. U2-2l]MCB8746892.1 glycosyltransferase family 2 protein [Rhodoferax sp. U2-2l]
MENMSVLTSPDHKFTLKRLDSHCMAQHANDVRLFLVERNEITRLPYLLTYYRNLGVEQFFVVDDKSNDGSREYLLTQKDCRVFEPSNTFKESRAGVDWQNMLLDECGVGHWTLVADADELLAYPHMERIKLPELCRYLEEEGSLALFGFLLDMYPKDDLSTGVCVPDKPFFEICPYFDADYIFRKISARTSQINELPRIRVVGGPRIRKFYPRQKRVDFINRLLNTVAIKIGERLTFLKQDRPHYAPALIKMPLVKWATGVKRLSNHVILAPPGSKVSLITGAILHFKFFADFHEKAKNEVSRGVHFGGSLEYKRYLRHTQQNPGMVLFYPGSKKYADSSSLLTAGLIQSNENFDSYLSKKAIDGSQAPSHHPANLARHPFKRCNDVLPSPHMTPMTPMTSMCMNQLIHRSGVAFGTSGARGLVAEMTDELCYAYASAFLQTVAKGATTLVLGHDLRPSSPRMAAACAAAAADHGAKVIYAGALPTPALAYHAAQLGVPAVVITGSHIPFDRNGIKFYRVDGEISKADEQAMLAATVTLPASLEPAPLPAPDVRVADAYVQRYTEFFGSSALAGLRVAVYEHSSVGRDILRAILLGLGADVLALGRTEVFVPIDTEAVRPEDIAQVIRTRIGSPYVIAGMNAAQGAGTVVGFEANGGFLLGSDVQQGSRQLARLPTRDAVLPMLALLCLARQRGCKLSELSTDLPKRFTASDRLQSFANEKSRSLIQTLLANPADMARTLAPDSGAVISVDQTDGLRVTFANQDIVHLRPSGNAPELRCYAEAATPAAAKALCDAGLARVGR